MEATAVSFGFNTALSFTIDMLDRAHQAAKSARKIGVVEILGSQSGWLALQSGIAVMADAVVIPEIRCDIAKLAKHMKNKVTKDRPYGLVVVAEGAKFLEKESKIKKEEDQLKKALSPLATGDDDSYVINRSGKASETLALGLQQILAEEVYPLVLGPWTRGGVATAVDRQLGLAYGAGAVRALDAGHYNTMVAFVPPTIKFVPLEDALNKVRTVKVDNEFIKTAHSLGIYTGV
jgi:6-phosphofructokinase 1